MMKDLFSNVMFILWSTLSSPANLIIFLIIVYLFYITLKKVSDTYRSLESEIRTAEDYLDGVKLENIDQEYILLSNKFKENPYFQHQWMEFDETLRKMRDGGTVAYFNTVEASYFLNEETLFYQKMDSSFFFAVPALLTGIGIFGTFMGLVIGLKYFVDIDLSNSTAMNNAMGQLLKGVPISFLTSFWGILFSLILNGLLARVKDRVSKLVGNFSRKLESIFPRHISAEGEGLFEIKKELEKHTVSLESFSTKLSIAVCESIENSINKSLAPSIDKITAVMESFSMQNSENVTKTLGDLVSKFSNSISGAAKEESARLSGVMQNVSETLQQSHVALSALLQQLDQTMNNQKDLSNIQSNSIQGVIETVKNFDSSAELMSKLTNNQLDTLNKFGDVLDNVNSIKEITGDLNDILQLSKESSLIYQQSSTSLKAFADSIQSSIGSSQRIFQEQQMAIEKLVPTFRQIQEVVNNIGEPMSELEQIVLALKDISSIKADTADKVDLMVSKLDHASSAFENSSKTVSTILGSLQQTSEYAETLWSGYKDTFVNITKELNEGVIQYTEQVKHSTEDLFGQYGEQVGTAFSKLSQGIETLQEALDEFQDTVEATASKENNK